MATAATPKLTDKGGEEIRIGCRVAEADFSYGDGVVESITVPITGDGFNVGIKWDTPELGGPPWSAEGGGRSAEHLLVLGPPPELLQRSTKWTDWCSRWRAFQRSFVACWASNDSWASGRASFAPLAWYAYRAHVRSSCSAGASPSPPSSAIRRGLCSCCGSADCCPSAARTERAAGAAWEPLAAGRRLLTLISVSRHAGVTAWANGKAYSSHRPACCRDCVHVLSTVPETPPIVSPESADSCMKK